MHKYKSRATKSDNAGKQKSLKLAACLPACWLLVACCLPITPVARIQFLSPKSWPDPDRTARELFPFFFLKLFFSFFLLCCTYHQKPQGSRVPGCYLLYLLVCRLVIDLTTLTLVSSPSAKRANSNVLVIECSPLARPSLAQLAPMSSWIKLERVEKFQSPDCLTSQTLPTHLQQHCSLQIVLCRQAGRYV